MAANALTGLGIALGGRTKDYTQVKMAQRKQEQLAERAKQESERKRLEDITKDIAIKPGEYLPWRERQIKDEVGKFIENYDRATGYGEKAQLKFELLSNLDKYKNEKKEADQYRMNVAKGSMYVDDDVEALYSAKDLDEIRKSSKYGGIFEAPDGTVRVKGYDAVDIPSRQQAIAAKVKTDWENASQQIGPDGKPMLRGEPDPKAFAAMLGADFDQNDLVRANAMRQYRNQIESEGFQGDAALNRARELYIQKGLQFLTGSQLRGAGGGITINNSLGGEGDDIDFETSPIPKTQVNVTMTNSQGKPFVASVNIRGAQSLGDSKATLPSGTQAYYIDTGESVSDSDISTGTYNQFGVVYILSKDIKIGDRVYKRGTPIPDQYEKLAVRKGVAKPEKVVFVKSKDRSFTVPAEVYFQTKIMDATTSKNNPEKQKLNSMFNRLDDDYNAELKNYDDYRNQQSEEKAPPQSAPAKTAQPSGSKTPITQPKSKERLPSNARKTLEELE